MSIIQSIIESIRRTEAQEAASQELTSTPEGDADTADAQEPTELADQTDSELADAIDDLAAEVGEAVEQVATLHASTRNQRHGHKLLRVSQRVAQGLLVETAPSEE